MVYLYKITWGLSFFDRVEESYVTFSIFWFVVVLYSKLLGFFFGFDSMWRSLCKVLYSSCLLIYVLCYISINCLVEVVGAFGDVRRCFFCIGLFLSTWLCGIESLWIRLWRKCRSVRPVRGLWAVSPKSTGLQRKSMSASRSSVHGSGVNWEVEEEEELREESGLLLELLKTSSPRGGCRSTAGWWVSLESGMQVASSFSSKLLYWMRNYLQSFIVGCVFSLFWPKEVWN